MNILALMATITTLCWMCKKPVLVRLFVGLGLVVMDLIVIGRGLDLELEFASILQILEEVLSTK